MFPKYNVPIIPQNLRREEAIVQIADALRYINSVVNDMFDRINHRIEEHNTQIATVFIKINELKVKVAKLSGAKKATQIFSSSKYPAADIHRLYQSVFDGEELPFIRSQVKYKELQQKEEPLETLQFYHVKIHEVENVYTTNGLGDIPVDINCVNDLLLYNTGKNPYKNYVISDPLQTSSKTKKDNAANVSDIGAAPHSISEKATLTRSTTESYFYSPDLGNVPSIDVPLDLPDLPGIADDLRYVDEMGPGIAPSVTTTPSVPELPPLDVELLSPANDNPAIELLPPPPPPPTVESPINIQQLPTVPIATEPKPVLHPPDPIEHSTAEHEDFEVKSPVAPDDMHASLMEAIRKAGGSKNAKLRTTEPKRDPPPGGDLMADLHAKLALRRKGISGTKNQENQSIDSSSAMTKISAMIPPPVQKADQSESTNTEDEDWDE